MKGIIMRAESVWALLTGRKTMTRRVIKPRVVNDQSCPQWDIDLSADGVTVMDFSRAYPCWEPLCSPYLPGETVYVKETWRAEVGYDHMRPSQIPPEDCDGLWYAAGGSHKCTVWMTIPGRVRSPIHMPEWAARLHLTITDVRAERLQDIEPDDVLAEGLNLTWDSWGRYSDTAGREEANAYPYFRDLWNQTGGKRPGCSWDDDPFVWVYTFEVQP